MLVRNVYTLIDLGKFVDGSGEDNAEGFIQMLPITDVNAAHTDFVNVRLSGKDTTSDAQWALLPASEGQKSPESEKEKKQHLEEKVLSHWPEIFVGSFLVFCGIVGFIVWRCCCRRRCAERKKAKALARQGLGSDAGAGGSKPISGFGKRMSVSMQMNALRANSTYQPLEEHGAPPMMGSYPSAYDVNHPPSYHGGYRV